MRQEPSEASHREQPEEPAAEFEEDTKVVPNAFTHDPDFAPTASFARDEGETFETLDESVTPAAKAGPSDDEPTTTGPAPNQGPVATGPSARAGIADSELLELSATTVATNIDMDWDEDEVETKLRDEGAAYDDGKTAAPVLPLIGGRPSPFPPARSGASPLSGNPSPFLTSRTSFPPSNGNDGLWEDEEEAMTTVMAPGSISLPTLSAGSTFAYGMGGLRVRAADVGRKLFSSLADAWSGGEHGERSPAGNRWAWMGFAAVALIAFAVASRALIGGREPATVTLITKPADALVAVDGRPLTGQSSPFTVQGLKPGVEHTLEVRKDGFATETHRFRVAAGEVKPLPTVELPAARVDTGFALASLPAGATVYVDGRKLDQATPIRIADLASGLHVLRLEYGSAYQPWETQVALAAGQVIELPTARLVPAAPPQATMISAPKNAGSNEHARSSEQVVASRESSSSRHHSQPREQRRESSMMPQPMMPQPMQQPMQQPMPVHMAAPTPMGGAFAGASGSQGALRVNSRPWSQVFVDGRMVGNTPQLNLALPSGHHKIKLVNPQLGMSKGFAVDIRAGKVATKVVDLE